jgi:hypothetical protein
MNRSQPIAPLQQREDEGLVPAVCCWSLTQIAALAMAAAEWPLALAQEQPTERIALGLLVSIQFAGGALFAGPLLGGRAKSLMTMALVWPMLQLAGLLAGEPQAQVLAASVAVTLWLGALACWTAIVPGRGQPILGAIASAWALGGIALAYCHADFGSMPGQSTFPAAAWLSPLLGGLSLAANPINKTDWVVLAANLCVAAMTLIGCQLRHQRNAATVAPAD